MDDQIQVRCSRCKGVFRERAGRLQDGFSRQCPSCEIVLFFNETSPDLNIKRAMRDAREGRKRLRDAERERLSRPAPSPLPRTFSGRSINQQEDF
jgi:hypothetical protein